MNNGGPKEGTLIYWKDAWQTGEPRLRLFFAMVEGQAHCVRIEIGSQFLPGENPRRLGARFAPRPRPVALDVSKLRKIKLQAETKKAMASWRDDLDEISRGSFVGQRIAPEVRRQARELLALAQDAARRGQPGPEPFGREHYEKVAIVYRDAHVRRDPPTLAVMEHFNTARSTAGRWVGIARNRYHLLPKTTKGKARSYGRPKR